jgi:hypothetical protein
MANDPDTGTTMAPPNERQRLALQAIASDDQGQGGALDVFEARECEAFGWVVKEGASYRLTVEGRLALEAATRKIAG